MALSNAFSLRVAVLLLGLLGIPAFAGAAGCALIAPPLNGKGNYLRNVPVNGSWAQIAAFDTAAQCEAQRTIEIKSWEGQMDKAPDGENKEWLKQRWLNAFGIRCMPYVLWWTAQQQQG
jgi:hypothetical protein